MMAMLFDSTVVNRAEFGRRPYQPLFRSRRQVLVSFRAFRQR